MMCQRAVHVWGDPLSSLHLAAMFCVMLWVTTPETQQGFSFFFPFVAHCQCGRKRDVKKNQKWYINIYIEKIFISEKNMKALLWMWSEDIFAKVLILTSRFHSGMKMALPFPDWQELSTVKRYKGIFFCFVLVDFIFAKWTEELKIVKYDKKKRI